LSEKINNLESLVIFRMNKDDNLIIMHWLYFVYELRGILLFLWMLTCPLFRKITFDTLKMSYFWCRKKKDEKMKSESYLEFDELLNRYNNTNSFLYSSLNMEIVCSILKGINIVLREINLSDKKQKML
jgi:hypothetical protein